MFLIFANGERLIFPFLGRPAYPVQNKDFHRLVEGAKSTMHIHPINRRFNFCTNFKENDICISQSGIRFSSTPVSVDLRVSCISAI